MTEKQVGEIANGDEDRCGYTVIHTHGDWGDYRCELVNEHFGPHAIGLRHHAVPLIAALEQQVKGLKGRPSAEQFAIVLKDREVAEQRLAEFENDEVPTRRELRLRRRQLYRIGERCFALLKADDRFLYLGRLPAEWYALRDAIAVIGVPPVSDGQMRLELIELLEESWRLHGE